MRLHKMYVNGEWRDSSERVAVYHKYSGEQCAEFAVTSAAEVDEAVAAAKKSFRENKLTPTQRYHILNKVAELLVEEQDDMAALICHEAGRCMGDSQWEVMRTVTSFQLAAEEARRIKGEVIPAEGMEGFENKICYTVRKPLGIVGIIMPFNVPLVLTANKLAPALAAGNTVVLKPASVCPGYAVKLVEILLKAGLPANHIQLILGSGSVTGEALLKNEDVGFYCFTGSMKMGEHVRNTVGLRKCSMDLGNNGAVIIHKDTDVKAAAENMGASGYMNAGQLCFRPQRLYVHEDILDDFVKYLKEYTETVTAGDPEAAGTVVGPLISAADVDRVDSWVKEAIAEGAELVIGGEKKTPHVYQPTVLLHAKPDMKVVKDEIFGPVLAIIPYKDFDEAIAAANDSLYGLHYAAFTKDISLAMKAIDQLEAGGVIINDTTAVHIPNMPFGGIKKSGAGGSESPSICIEEMTDEKTIIISM